MDINLNVTIVEQTCVQAFQDTCLLLGREFTKVISEPGAFDAFPDSDIVDTGQLRAAQQLEFRSPGLASYSWNLDYAAAVHFGYTLRNGEEEPGRPWTELGLERFDFEGTYGKLLADRLGTESP